MILTVGILAHNWYLLGWGNVTPEGQGGKFLESEEIDQEIIWDLKCEVTAHWNGSRCG